MRFIVFIIGFTLSVIVNAQKLVIGGCLTPAYGNIAYKSKVFDPTNSIGGGIMLNYYTKKWVFNTGLNYKNPCGSQKIPITPFAQPKGDGSFKTLKYFMNIVTIPIRFHYQFLSREKLKFYTGVTLENGVILENKLFITESKAYLNIDSKTFMNLNKGYYIGIMPQIRVDCKLSERKIMFVNLGVNYQLNTMVYKTSIPESVQVFRVNSVFLDIGFSYYLGK